MKTNSDCLLSLDALRGFDMFWIFGWGGLWHGRALILVLIGHMAKSIMYFLYRQNIH